MTVFVLEPVPLRRHVSVAERTSVGSVRIVRESALVTRSDEGGFEPRFEVTRTDGRPIDTGRRYMVLSYDGSDPEAVEALRVYARLKREKNPALADDLERHLDDPAGAPPQHRWAFPRDGAEVPVTDRH